jgi:hypothetical protein
MNWDIWYIGFRQQINSIYLGSSLRGAFATSFPSGEKIAHEKSSRSLILEHSSVSQIRRRKFGVTYLVLMAVRCKVWPICSAIDINRCENIVNCTGLTTSQSSSPGFPDSARSMTICDLRIETMDPDSTSIVCVSSMINPGPFQVSEALTAPEILNSLQ